VEKYLRAATEMLLAATGELDAGCFHFREAGRTDPKTRERVYCYELYALIRARRPKLWPFSLAGEPDKKAHRYIRGGVLEGIKPDIIFHVPGRMDRNLLAVEVKKGADAKTEDLATDLRKLTALRDPNRGRYHGACLLVFGGSDKTSARMRSRCARQAAKYPREIDLDVIDLFVHTKPGVRAVHVPWR
jgi:hypothetical protein